jgi:hypothetical protein
MSKSVKKGVFTTDNLNNVAASIVNPAPLPVPVMNTGGGITPLAVESTNWTAAKGGNFNTPADWSNGVPTTGVDAYIEENSNNSITVTISGVSDIADSLTTEYAGLLISSGTLTLEGAGRASGITTGTATGLTEKGGLLDFENGPSQNQVSYITSGGPAVDQTSGIIEVDAGTLEITGNSIFDGTLTGSGDKPDSGTIALQGFSTYDFGSAAVVSVGVLDLEGSNMVLAGNLTLDGGFNQSSSTTITMVAGKVLLLDDTATLKDSLSGVVTGGTVQNDAATALTGETLTSNTTFTNDGTLLLNNGGGVALTLDTTATALPLLINASGHAIDVLNGSYTIQGGTFTNAGSIVLETAGSLTVTSLLTDTGSISVAAADVFTIDNQFSASGAISGAGTFQIEGPGSDTIASTSKISVADFVIDPGSDGITLTIDTASITSAEFQIANTVNFGTSVSYAGTFIADPFDFYDAPINLGTHTLSLSGTAIFDGVNSAMPEVTGTGTLALSGTTTLTDAGMILANGMTMLNSGTLSDSSILQIGTSAGSAAVTNTATGVWDLVGSSSAGGSSELGVNGGNLLSTFTNAGLFENAGGISQIPEVFTDFINSGKISIAAGYETDFYGTLDNTGTISGAGTLGLGEGTTTFGSGTVLGIGQLKLFNSATITLSSNLTYTGLFNDLGDNTSTLDLGSEKLSLGGQADFGSDSGSAYVSGGGTLALEGATSIGDPGNAPASIGLEIGGTAELVNTGTVTQTGGVQIGETAAGLIASITNGVSGKWIFTTTAGISDGSNASSSFVNSGLLENSGTGNTVTISAVLNTSGTLEDLKAGSGIDITNGGTIGGKLSGAGTIALDSGIFTLCKATTLSVATLGIDNAQLNIASPASYAGTLDLKGGTLALGASTATLTLTGQDALDGLVTGNGTVLDAGGTLTADTLTLGGGDILLDKGGMIFQGANITIGNGSASTASLDIASGSSYELSEASSISGTGVGGIVNAGNFGLVAGSGTSSIGLTFTNTGTVTDTSGGTLAFATSFVNDNLITASGSAVVFEGSITGTGSIDLTGASMATIGGYAASGQTMVFTDSSSSTATIDSPGQFDAAISGFSGDNALLLADFDFSKSSYSGGTLTLTGTSNGGTASLVHLDFAGTYESASFAIISTQLSTGGYDTLITYTGHA